MLACALARLFAVTHPSGILESEDVLSSRDRSERLERREQRGYLSIFQIPKLVAGTELLLAVANKVMFLAPS